MKNYLLLFVSLASLSLYGQEVPASWLKNTPARNIGPGGMSGRITSIDVVTQEPEVIYVGTASGGVWKSTSGGIDWFPLFENQVTASVGAIAIQQSSPDVVWVGTGEGNPRNSLNGGFGIYKTLDGGKTWQAMGLSKTRHIHRIIIHPNNPDIVYVAAIGSPWGEHAERGVYKTTNGGKTWRKVLYQNPKTGAADLIMDPSNPNKLIAAMWEHKRDPWFFNSGGEGSGIFISYDGGQNWKEKTEENGLPKGPLGRVGLAMATNKPNIVYALVESKKNALYKSIDGGEKWKKINDKEDIGNRPFYYSDIRVDPQNENRIYSVFTYVNVSEDGGKNFSSLMPAYGVSNGVHPDHHAWWIHPENGDFMIDGNDGGLNITRDGGKSWRFVGNIPVAQFYHISVDNEIPYNVYGGMQDNGSWRGPAYTWRVQGIRNSYWQEIAFGDGFDVVPDPDDSRYGYAMSQQGYVSRYDWKTGNNYLVRPTHPNPDTQLRFNWNAAIGQDPFDNSTLYFGSQFVHKSIDKGLTWEVISPDLTTNDPEKQKQSESGGLTLDATGAENHCTLLVIEPSTLEKDMLWAASDDGRVHYTQDGGDSWIEVTKNIKGLPSGSWIAQIKASNKNKGEALLIANDYRRYNYTPYAYRTTNYGKTWKRIVKAEDVESYTLSIVEDPVSANLLFLGTDDGLYYSINAGEKWQKMDPKVFPTVPTKDLVIHPREHDLVIGTFGRAAWVLDDIRPLRALAEMPSIANKKAHLFTPSAAYLASYQQPTGSRFGADAMYHGENRKSGAMFTYYYAPTEKEESPKTEKTITEKVEKKKGDSLTLNIYDGDRLIRTLKRKVPKEKGFHRWYWRMDEKGVQRPRRKMRASKSEPGGATVLPGTYTAELSLNGSSNKVNIEVKVDPRIITSEEGMKVQYAAYKELEALIEVSAKAVEQLGKSKSTLADYEKRIKKQDAKKHEDLLKRCKEVSAEITRLVDLFLGKEDKRQGIVRNPEPTVMARVYGASRYVNSRPAGITSTEQTLIKHAKDQASSSLEKVNSFYEETWKGLQEEIEAIELSSFEPVSTFDIQE